MKANINQVYSSKNRPQVLRVFFVFMLGLCFNQLLSQVAYNPKNASSKKAISAEFLYAEVEFKEIAVMTNVLKIKNLLDRV